MNRSQFVVKGLNQEKAFNNLSKEIKVYKIKRPEYNLSTFEVDSKNEKKANSILSSMGLEVTVVGHKGFVKKLKSFFSFYGIICGIVISILFYILQYNFILKIEIWGNENLSASVVKDYADSLLGSHFKSKVDTKEIENKIKNKFNLASSVSVAIVGQTLIINLNEGILPPEMEDEFAPIISNEDGLVTSITLIQGTLNVKVGDIVKKGDVLVFPYIIDADGNERKVKPQADIEAEVWLRKEYCHKDYVVKSQRTGEKAVCNRVLLNGKEIYKYESKTEFDCYEEETTYQNLISSNLIPFKFERTTRYELETVEINNPFEDNKEEIVNLARENVLIFLQKNEIIKDEKYFVREGGGCYFIDYIITTCRNIGG